MTRFQAAIGSSHQAEDKPYRRPGSQRFALLQEKPSYCPMKFPSSKVQKSRPTISWPFLNNLYLSGNPPVSVMLPPEILDVAAGLIGLGLLISVLNSRAGSVSMGMGSVMVGAALLSNIPTGWEVVAVGFFGLIIVAGLWMISVGIKKQRA